MNSNSSAPRSPKANSRRAVRRVVQALLAAFCVFLRGFLQSADPVETLIDDEKKDAAAWKQPEEEMPPVMLDGTTHSVLIHGPYEPMIGTQILCTDLEFDEILSLQHTGPTEGDIPVNDAMPAVRERIEKACLVRPGDTLMAIGPGWQRSVTLKRFVIHPERAICPEDSPYLLWAEFEPPLDEAPLLFSTDPTLHASTNAYRAATQWEAIQSDTTTAAALAHGVSDLGSYQTELFRDPIESGRIFARLSRKQVSADDDKSPNEILGLIAEQEFHSLWIERVDARNGSGHARFLGALDINGDGKTDLLIQGEHGTCPYRVFLDGAGGEFHPFDYPQKPCRC